MVFCKTVACYHYQYERDFFLWNIGIFLDFFYVASWSLALLWLNIPTSFRAKYINSFFRTPVTYDVISIHVLRGNWKSVCGVALPLPSPCTVINRILPTYLMILVMFNRLLITIPPCGPSPNPALTQHTNITLLWRHNEHDGVSNHQPHDCLVNHSFQHTSKKA